MMRRGKGKKEHKRPKANAGGKKSAGTGLAGAVARAGAGDGDDTPAVRVDFDAGSAPAYDDGGATVMSGDGSEDGERKEGGDLMTGEGEAEAAVERALDLLVEKREATRVQGLKLLSLALRSKVLDDYVEDKTESLFFYTLKAARGGSAAESVLGSECAQLLCLTAGAGHPELFERCEEALGFAVDRGKKPEAKAAALTALAMACFVCAEEQETTVKVLELCARHIAGKRTPTALRTAALGAYAHLLTAMPSKYARDTALPSQLPVLKAMLEHPDTGVRRAAGEVLAMMYDAKWSLARAAKAASGGAAEGGGGGGGGGDGGGGDGDGDGDGDEGGAGGGGDAGGAGEAYGEDARSDDDVEEADEEAVVGASSGGVAKKPATGELKEYDWRAVTGWEEEEGPGTIPLADRLEMLADEVVALVAKLANDSSRHRSKRDKKVQRSTFRDVLGTLRGEADPESIVRIRVSTATLMGWVPRVQLDRFREVLTTGLQSHLEFNPLLREVLALRGDVVSSERLSGTEKRKLFSPNSNIVRARESNRAAGRARKQAAQSAFAGAED